MAADNTLGAPTEGLGQTVTFAGGQGRAEPQTPTIQRQSLRAGESGGTATRTAEALRTPDPVGNTIFQTLARFGGEVLKPKLEAERALSFAKGMQQAAQGQAITEIVEEQPWYSQVFGSTSLVDGARAYSASAQATNAAVEIETKMPELRKLSANEMSKYTADLMVRSAKTGDATTDAMIASQLAQTLPGTLKNQAKEHLRYQQEVLETGITSSLSAQAAKLGIVASKARSADSIIEDADAFDEEIKFSQLFVKPAEMDAKLHNKLVATAVGQALGVGNFAAYDVLERSGKMAELSPEEQYMLRRSRQNASTTAKGNIPVELFVKSVEWRTMSDDPSVTWEQQLAMRDAVNAEYTKLTGDTEPLINNALTATELLQRRAKEQAAAAKANAPTALDKQNTKEEQKLIEVQGLMGEALSGKLMINLDPKDQQAVFNESSRYLPPALGMNFRAHQWTAGIVDKDMQRVMQASVQGALLANDPIALAKAYETHYLPMLNNSGELGTQMVRDYFGKDAADTMERYHKVVRGGQITPELTSTAYIHATVKPVPDMSGKRQQEAVKVLKSGMWDKAYQAIGNLLPGESNYPLENPTEVAGWVYSDVSPGAENMEDAVGVAIKNSATVTVLGGVGWQRTSRSTNIRDYFSKQANDQDRVAPSEQSRAFKLYLDKVRGDSNMDGNIALYQHKDVDGVPQFGIVGKNYKGETVVMNFTGKDVIDAHKVQREADKRKWAFGDAPVTHRDIPKDGRPSLYAGDAAWKAWAEQQRK